MEFLGYIISLKSVFINLKRVTIIKKWLVLKTFRDI